MHLSCQLRLPVAVAGLVAIALVVRTSSAAAADLPPAGITLPLVVWDIDFNDNPLDVPPQPLTKAQIEAQTKLNEWQRLPVRSCDGLEYVTETRRALVVKEAGGLKDRPLLLTYTESAQPHYGPKVCISVPPEVAKHGAIWSLSFDVAKGNVAISGGIHLWDVCGIEFFEDGTVRAGTAEIARYAANQPLHVECRIDTLAKTAVVVVNGNRERSVTIPWRYAKAEFFQRLNLHGVLPGGHCEVPSSMVFDNIRLVLETWR